MIAANPKIEALMLAIGEHEGWTPAGADLKDIGSIAYRNHNPGNLRASPFETTKRGGFSVFRNDFVGMMALHWDLMQKAHGNTSTGLSGKSTLRELITVYAPPSDNNDTEKYIAAVVKKTGLPETTTLDEIFKM